MKALQVQGPDEVKPVEAPAPQPKCDEVLLRAQMIGMCGSDLSTFRGKNLFVSCPRVLGHEIAAAVGDGPAGAKFGILVRVDG